MEEGKQRIMQYILFYFCKILENQTNLNNKKQISGDPETGWGVGKGHKKIIGNDGCVHYLDCHNDFTVRHLCQNFSQ